MENNIEIEERSNGKYILTGQKHKGQDIVIKIGSIIDKEAVLFEENVYKKDELIWTLEYDNGLYVKLSAYTMINGKVLSYKCRVDTTKCINELVNMVKENATLDTCEEIKKAIYKCNNEFFKIVYNNGYIMHSNNIIEGLVAVINENKILGYGSRFILNKNEFTLCEYVGQTITRDMNLKFEMKDELIKLTFHENRCIYDEDEKVYSKGSQGVGYLKYNGRAFKGLNEEGIDIPVYPKLKVPYIFSDKEKMILDVINLNKEEDIQAYKLALRGKIELIDVNKYMLNEYLI